METALVHVLKWMVTPVVWSDCSVWVSELELLSLSSPQLPSRVLCTPKGLECLHGLQQQLCHPGNDPTLGQTWKCVY